MDLTFFADLNFRAQSQRLFTVVTAKIVTLSVKTELFLVTYHLNIFYFWKFLLGFLENISEFY